MKEEPKYKFVIDPNARPLSNDDICKALFGMSLKELVRDIRINRDGKYDKLYKKDDDKKESEK